ncbi:MAG: hypothetical protein HQL58_06275 [Magnetococcales bacterium]|nr:hypothetical protein [Magnetococcales bacterium]
MLVKRKIRLPTVEEEATINQGIAADQDTLEVGDDAFAQLKLIDIQHSSDKTKMVDEVFLTAEGMIHKPVIA